MEFDELERSVRKLNEVINEFPIGATSLDDFKPIEEKIQTTRESLMRLNARLLLLRAKYKRMSLRLYDAQSVNCHSKMLRVTF